MKRNFLVFLAISTLCLSAVLLSLVKMVRAADSDTVAATVTAVIYALTVDNVSIAFGSVAQNSTKNTVEVGSETSTAENTGSVAAKINIKAGNSTGGTGWTLAGTAGSETYTMKSSLGVGSTSPWTSVGIDPSYATLTASLGVGSTQPFELQVGTPTTTTVTEEQSITITLQAVAL